MTSFGQNAKQFVLALAKHSQLAFNQDERVLFRLPDLYDQIRTAVSLELDSLEN